MKQAILATTPECTRCKALIAFFRKHNVPYLDIDISTVKGLTEARTDYGLFVKSGGSFLFDRMLITPNLVFKGDDLQESALKRLLGIP